MELALEAVWASQGDLHRVQAFSERLTEREEFLRDMKSPRRQHVCFNTEFLMKELKVAGEKTARARVFFVSACKVLLVREKAEQKYGDWKVGVLGRGESRTWKWGGRGGGWSKAFGGHVSLHYTCII